MLIASKYKMSFDEFVGLSEKILKNEFNAHVSNKFVSNCFTVLFDFSLKQSEQFKLFFIRFMSEQSTVNEWICFLSQCVYRFLDQTLSKSDRLMMLDFNFCLNDLNECFMEYKKVFCDNGEFLGWEKID